MSLASNKWLEILSPEFSKPYYKNLFDKVNDEYSKYDVYPPSKDIFNALNITNYDDVKIVIIGQDPYHEKGQAMGLAFSVNKGITPPPSLVNIYKELQDDLGIVFPGHGDLTGWAKQGVLLLNTVLTVRAHQANSHKGIGWEEFTDAIIKSVNMSNKPTVFMLWGANAASKALMVTNPKHLVLKAPHPSPLSAYRGFFGCKHFSKANDFLNKNNREPINWQL